MANNDFDLDKSFDGVYFLKKSNNGKILYSSKGLSKTCSSALDDTSSVIYDDESERYFYLKKQQNNDGIQAVFIDITEQILTINKLRGDFQKKTKRLVY